MEQSAKDFAAWRKTREREVQQLRRAGRKQAAHVQKLEALQAKQAAVLRRKTEEAEAARRRLKVCVPFRVQGTYACAETHVLPEIQQMPMGMRPCPNAAAAGQCSMQSTPFLCARAGG